VNLGGIQPAAGDVTIAYADGHGASFQVGVGTSASAQNAVPAQDGVLHLDTWSGEAGSTVTGKLKLANATSSVEGTFSAIVCPPR
jgi:hypothetical protein